MWVQVFVWQMNEGFPVTLRVPRPDKVAWSATVRFGLVIASALGTANATNSVDAVTHTAPKRAEVSRMGA